MCVPDSGTERLLCIGLLGTQTSKIKSLPSNFHRVVQERDACDNYNAVYHYMY